MSWFPSCSGSSCTTVNSGPIRPKGPIPERAYLVVGSSPEEDRKGREFYTNSHFYQLDTAQIRNPNTDTSRYIQGDFNDITSGQMLASEFSEKFDVVIFDASVGKFLGGDVKGLGNLLAMVKPGGTLILDTITGLSGVSGIRMNQGINAMKKQIEEISKANEREFLENLEQIIKPYTLKVTTCKQLVYAGIADGGNLIARMVYGPLLENDELVKSKYVTPESPCIIIKKVISGGKRNTRKKRKLKKPSRRAMMRRGQKKRM
uniref:Methyltransferase n=1 Tax=viral metagenome TaxID=1070528 RepID=A0A6C0AMP3_9ZZZZ